MAPGLLRIARQSDETPEDGQQVSCKSNVADAPLIHVCFVRALMEGWASGMWERFTGVLLWKTQNPWAGLRGQLYDWRLAQNGGFYGVRCACEPLHVQLNLHTMQALPPPPSCSNLHSLACKAGASKPSLQTVLMLLGLTWLTTDKAA